ncbi:centrosomal protein of 295 kDa isoform X5 [Carassius gibelio]|uniref:centrosomal protein of 295 kDa isoform X3 n=1 Tax=Carassius gibelio TaxID=101364 RepID=UPI0022792FAC|nr:centrosomal protein of 295 kDa isoform X3 [Carassius gibelio]XP_052471871.1 centrosomal protein of 295 kDa isoform X4 [Carassius gibelio]XP_052471872.1 centrosomal protein of 295 kDa isoform X5 [Carassius gibelio]
MRGRVSVRLSPNEEAQLEREELHRRRKLRLQQVREQERFIARQVRTQVQERRQQQLQSLADSLQLQWQQQQMLRLQALSTHYQHSLGSVGHGHRSAQENEPDLQARAQRTVERQERAEERHREALRELSTRRHQEEQQQRRQAEARRKALLEEKRRAERVASLPPPPPDPVESIETKTRPLRSAAAERFSLTHCHMTQTAVERETDPEPQPSARQAAAQEIQRLEELRRQEARDTQERLEKARLRGNHALRTEQHTQERERLLCDLERLQQADLMRRRQTVNSVPAQIFQPLYRQQELQDEHQRELEMVFQDVCTEERKVKGDLVLQLVPEPLPPLSTSSHDEELDVTLDPECAPEEEEPETPGAETAASSADPGRQALSRLLERIRRQRDLRSRQLTTHTPLTSPDPDPDTQDEALSVETGSFSSREQSSEQETPSTHTTHTQDAPDVSDEAVLAGTVLRPDEGERGAHMDQQTHVEALLKQQKEQLALLEELEEKRRELEQRLRHSQQTSATLQEAAHRQSTTLPEPPAEVKSDVTQTQRLHQYQQRLLEQNRLHKKCVEEARRRLEEYQHTLKLRHTISSTSAAVSVPLETPSAQRPLSPDARVLHPAASQQTHASGSEASAPQDGPVWSGPPLPPPSVVLELLRSRQQPASRSSEVSGSVRAEQMCVETQRQRHFLQALITADRQGSASSFSDVQTDRITLNTLLNAFEDANGHTETLTAPSQRDGATHTTTVLSNGSVCDPAPVHRGRVKPPVSRPPARLAFLQQMEQHELSAIQEVDSPVNISLDAELQSSSTSLPAVSSEDSHSGSQRSQVTGRISRMSWRETLLCDATASASPSSVNQQQECLGAVDPDYLSSTTISTGSYSTSDREPSYVTSEASHLCTEPDVCGLSPKSSSCHMTTDQTQEMRDSVQQIIDKYSQELRASLSHAGASSGASQSWSSALQEETSVQDGDSQSTDTALSSTELSGVFQPLQPQPDIDSSSSSSAGAVRADASAGAQDWSEAMNRILQHLSDQLSIRRSEQEPGDQRSSVGQDRTAHVQSTHSRYTSPEPSVVSQLIGRASDMGSSQVFDQSSVLTHGPEELTLSTAAGPALCFAPVRSSLQPSVSQMSDDPQDDASDLFLPLPSEVTANETADCSRAVCVPLEAEVCETDQSLQYLRVEPLLQSQPDLQISMDVLSLTHESLCDTDAVAPPTAADTSLMPRSPLKTSLQEVTSEPEPLLLTELLERAQAAGDVKGILEESTISFISLPESTLQDPELSLTQTPDTGSAAREEERDGREGESPSRSDGSEAVFPGTVMLLEFQSSSAPQQRRRDRLAQRSALRAAQIKERASRAGARTHPKPHTAERLKSVSEVRISSDEHRRREEEEMYDRTHRLYNQLEEVKQKKEVRSRQESYAKNREKARDFQKKTLEKLRAKLNR